MNKFVFLKALLGTIKKSNKEFVDHKMSSLIPFFLGLVVFSILMIFVNAVSPLAPFVYSLF